MAERQEARMFVVLDPVSLDPVLVTENYSIAFDIALGIAEKATQTCDLIKRVPVIQPVWRDE